jgi:hypothetical protein
MATGLKSDFVIYQEQLHSGFVETLQQETDIFNAASRGTILMRPKVSRGDYDQESFFASTASLVTRRVTTGTAATAAVTDLALAQEQNISVKLNRKIGPVANTMDSFRKITRDPAEMSFIIGQQAAKAVAVDMVNSGIRAAVGALVQTTGTQDLVFDASALSPVGEITSLNLIKALAKAGDSANDILAWVMHSASYFALMESQSAVLVTNIAGTVINEGVPVTLNRPVIVTDCPDLYTAGESPEDTPRILGLRPGAIVLDESELETMASDTALGGENLIVRVQGESAFNVGLKGFKYDISTGGENPNDTALALGTNWDYAAADDKSKAGVALVVGSGE